MPDQLYALQQDVDMIATQVQFLTRTLSDLDLILHRTQKMEVEQMCIGAQLGRLEKAFTEFKFGTEERLDKVERLLELICAKLDIKTA